MAQAKGKEKAQPRGPGGFLAKAGGLFASGKAALGNWAQAPLRAAVLLRDRFLDRVPGKKRMPLLLAVGLAVLFLILAVGAGALASRGPGKAAPPASASASASRGAAIPMEELFIPGEPDFVPEYLLEREPRSSWSVEDIRPYWKNPEGNLELWRKEIRSAVDELMEAVP